MTKEIKIIIGLLVAVLLVTMYSTVTPPLGGAPAGMRTTEASSTFITLTSGAETDVAATSTRCITRTITSGANPIGFEFFGLAGDHVSLYVPASTTVEVAPEIYGCGKMRARANGASSMTITEFYDAR